MRRVKILRRHMKSLPLKSSWICSCVKFMFTATEIFSNFTSESLIEHLL